MKETKTNKKPNWHLGKMSQEELSGGIFCGNYYGVIFQEGFSGGCRGKLSRIWLTHTQTHNPATRAKSWSTEYIQKHSHNLLKLLLFQNTGRKVINKLSTKCYNSYIRVTTLQNENIITVLETNNDMIKKIIRHKIRLKNRQRACVLRNYSIFHTSNRVNGLSMPHMTCLPCITSM